MDFANATELDSRRLEDAFLRHTAPYRHRELTVRVRYTRRADFSGSCYYQRQRIFVNIGRRLTYPYRLVTHVARSRCNATHWWREGYRLVVADAYQLALFIYLHELFHHLVKAAGRNTRRKEAMCDRFAARVLVDEYGCALIDAEGRAPPRTTWDFQDLERFVAAAPREPLVFAATATTVQRPIPVRILGVGRAGRHTVSD